MTQWQNNFCTWAASFSLSRGATRLGVDSIETTSIQIAGTIPSIEENLLIIAPGLEIAETANAELPSLQELTKDKRKIIFLPEVITNHHNQWLPENETTLCAALANINNTKNNICITTANALQTQVVSPKEFEDNSIIIKTGMDGTSPQQLAEELVKLDYDNEYEVCQPGEFSMRGGIIDIYSPALEYPVRVDFWDDTIDSIKTFDPETQRSLTEIDEFKIIPRGSFVSENKMVNMEPASSYFHEDTCCLIIDPVSIDMQLKSDEEDYSNWHNFIRKQKRVVYLQSSNSLIGPEYPAPKKEYPTSCFKLDSLFNSINDDLDGLKLWRWQELKDNLLQWQAHNYRIVINCSAGDEFTRIMEMLAEDQATARIAVEYSHLNLNNGFVIPKASLVVLTEKEVFGKKTDVRRRRKVQFHRKERSTSEDVELSPGSLAVHASHGICLYHGIKDMEFNGEVQEVLELEFADETSLYVSVEQSYLVTRYIGGSKKQPTLSKLGGVSWKRALENAESAALDFAAELIRIEAVRSAVPGTAFPKPSEWDRAFAASFPFTETDDQKQAIEDVLADMEMPKPMDRLLCGDVGYGKTEVAMRAAFRAVTAGMQVAVLVPTTVLAQQHYNTFCERMSEYPVSIEMLSRFKTRGEQNAVLDGVLEGTVDIVIGTHRIIQKDVKFKNLGLLIIDEEQRFGVQHKQRLKEMRASVDILTMTATPIPRTLYFSLSGLRNLSTIMTPPAERLPVSTIVCQYDKGQIQMAIERELARGGQIFILHNRVKTIENFAKTIQEMVPDAEIAIGHGRMSAGELETVMKSFISGKTDILVCTTIIESGIDIPNANTIIIDRADRFGLAELYQLRGRVGRYHNQAYCYLLLPSAGALHKDARERLDAIRRYTHLGAGFKLALRDLEIRGAGNILGAKQSGHIASVGFDLYCDLLKDAVNTLEKRPKQYTLQVNVSFDTIIHGVKSDSTSKVPACFPKSYLNSESLRVHFYKRLNKLQTLEELENFSTELIDRFGELPIEAQRLLKLNKIRLLALMQDILSVQVIKRKIYMETENGHLKNARKRLPYVTSNQADLQLEEIIDRLVARYERHYQTKNG